MSNDIKNPTSKQGEHCEEETQSLLNEGHSSSTTTTVKQNSNEAQINKSSDQANSRKTIFVSLAKILTILGVLYLIWTLVKSSFSEFIMDQIKDYSRKDPKLATGFFVFINVIFSWFPLPGLTYFDIAITALIRDFNYCFMVFFFSTFLAGVVCFIFVKYLFRERMLRRYGDNIMYKVFRDEVKKNPWAISWMVNCLLIPSCFKNIFLPLTDMTFCQFCIPKIPLYALFTLIVCVIGDQLDSIHQFKNTKDYDQKTSVEKFHFVITLILTCMTVGFIVWSGVIFKQKIDAFKEEEAKAVEKNRMLSKNDDIFTGEGKNEINQVI
jgi:uncharacterized membrane protein YdjX (TVP38/TMEM64 family)